MLVVGGVSDSAHSVALYDPEAGRWRSSADTDPQLCRTDSPAHPETPCPLLGGAREFHTATLLPSGRVAIHGGESSIAGRLDQVEIYDPRRGIWTASGELSAARSEHTATLLPSGAVWVTGGRDGDANVAGHELYDSATGSWRLITTDEDDDLRAFHTASLTPDGDLLVIGGFRYGGGGYLSTVRFYAPRLRSDRAPQLLTVPSPSAEPAEAIRYGTSFTLGGTRLYGDSEGGGRQPAAVGGQLSARPAASARRRPPGVAARRRRGRRPRDPRGQRPATGLSSRMALAECFNGRPGERRRAGFPRLRRCDRSATPRTVSRRSAARSPSVLSRPRAAVDSSGNSATATLSAAPTTMSRRRSMRADRAGAISSAPPVRPTRRRRSPARKPAGDSASWSALAARPASRGRPCCRSTTTRHRAVRARSRPASRARTTRSPIPRWRSSRPMAANCGCARIRIPRCRPTRS